VRRKLPEMLKLVPSVTTQLMEQLNLTEMVAFNADFDHIKGSHPKRGAKRDFVFRPHSGGGVEGSDLRQCPPEPTEAVFVFDKNNDGSGGHHAHLGSSMQDGVGTLPMLLTGGRRRFSSLRPISKVRGGEYHIAKLGEG
jgi:hypothetical protein